MSDNSKKQEDLQKTVLSEGLCTGCGACVGLCPYQEIYDDRTVILDPCDLDLCRGYVFCPRTPTDLDLLRARMFTLSDITPELGAIKNFFVTRAVDKQFCKNGQHGGTVSALMAMALDEGIIDTAILSDKNENCLPTGVVVNDYNSVSTHGGSNFVVSPTVAEFNKTVKRNDVNNIGVVATPCQALAFAKMRMKPIESNDNHIDKLKLVIGLFCGWALSWKGLVELLNKKNISLDDVAGIDIPPSKYQVLEVYTQNSGTIEISLDEVNPIVREGCHYCFDMTAEFADISVGSARLPEGWEEAKSWNQVIVRTELGRSIIEKARSKGVLEFRDVPEGNLDKLKKASLNKKRTSIKNLTAKSGNSKDLLYLNSKDSILSLLLE